MMIPSDCTKPFSAMLLLAYIDPNTGSILLQYLLPVFVAIGAAWALLKEKVSSKISQLLRHPKSGGEN